MKSNIHKKDFWIDTFVRKYYCDHARLGQLRSEKKQAKRMTRRKAKAECREIQLKSNKGVQHENYFS